MASPPNRQGLFVVGRFGSSRACCDGLKIRVGVVLFSERESAGRPARRPRHVWRCAPRQRNSRRVILLVQKLLHLVWYPEKQER